MQTRIFYGVDREKSIDLLAGSLSELKQLTGDLSDQQARYRPAENKWMIIEHLGHLSIVEEVVWKLIHSAIAKQESDEVCSISDKDFFRRVSSGEDKTTAPEFLQHTLIADTTLTMILGEFVERRYRTIDFLKHTTLNLRRYFSVNPVYGNLDTYQWTLHLSAHCYRHINQIKEVMSSPFFPGPAG